MKLNNLIMASAILLNSNNNFYAFSDKLPIRENMTDLVHECYQAFEFIYENESFYLSNRLATNNEENLIVIDSKYLTNLDVKIEPGAKYSVFTMYNFTSDVSNLEIVVTFEYYSFSNFPTKLDSLVLEYNFNVPGISERVGYYLSQSGDLPLVSSEISTWSDSMLIVNDDTITTNIFDTIKDVVGGYSDTITNTFDGLMGIFYDSETNTLKPIATLLLIPVGMGIVLFAYYLIKRLL